LLALGCRANNATVLLERDLRWQEDKIYHLQACLEDAEAAREATIRENEALKQELAGAARGGPPGGPGRDESFQPPSVELPGDEAPARGREAPDLAPPVIELPEPSDAPATDAPGGDAPAANETSVIVESPPTQLVINKRLTGGLDRDGHDGDEGILVVFEPRDAAGHLVKWPGKVSVVAMDPALEGPAARVARWDFASDEVPNHYLSTVFGRGLQFELPWPGNPPAHRELVLFVRFTTDDGRKITTDTKIEIRPPGAAAVDRQTRQTEPAGADGPIRRALRSRLKPRDIDGNAPRATRAPGGTDSAEASPADEDEPDVAEAGSGERAPQRSARPKWKPYR
jgi:hypothetical protein